MRGRIIYGFKNHASYHECTDELRRKLNHIPAIPDLDEVNSADLEKFIPEVFDDLDYDKEVLSQDLHVFTFDQIVGYMETSIEMAILNMRYMKIKYNS